MQDLTTPAQASTININGYQMRYVEQGAGEAVLFVHGSLTDYRCWNEPCAAVAKTQRAIAVDLRYFGTDEWPDDPEFVSIQTHADDLAAFIRALDIGPVTLVAWSYGGNVAFATAVQNPGLVKAMFMHEPSLATFLEDPDALKAATEDRATAMAEAAVLMERGDLAGAARAGIDGLNSEAGLFDRLPVAISSQFRENARTMPLQAAAPPPPNITADDLRALKIPVEFTIGENARKFHQIIVSAAAALLPNAALKSIDGARHLWPLEDTQAFTTLLQDFLARN